MEKKKKGDLQPYNDIRAIYTAKDWKQISTKREDIDLSGFRHKLQKLAPSGTNYKLIP